MRQNIKKFNGILIICIFFIYIFICCPIEVKSNDCIPDALTLSRQGQIDSFPILFPGCTEASGNLLISGSNIVNLEGLRFLKKIGNLTISDNPVLTSLSGLNSLNTIYYGINIIRNPSLNSLIGLDSLKIAFNFTISENPLLINLKGLQSLNSVPNSLMISNNINLADLEGLDKINYISNFSIQDNNNLESLNGIQSITKLDNLSIYRNNSIKNLKGLESVKQIQTLTVSYNNGLLSLQGISSLNNCTYLTITNNSLLNDISSLNPLIKISSISIESNPKLSCCLVVKSILENNPLVYISGIYRNDIGCNSVTEVRASYPTPVCCFTSNTTRNITICQGEQIIVGIHTYTSSGRYVDSIHIGTNCDSIIITNLTVRPKSMYTIQEKNLCIGQQFVLKNGNIIMTSGVYKDTILNYCDSIIEYRLNFLNNIVINQDIMICQGKSFLLPGGTVVNESGTYTDTLLSSFGCDSIIHTNLTLTPTIPFTQDISICAGTDYILPNGNNVNAAGIYRDTIRGSNVCDRIIVTNLSVFANTFSVELISEDTIDAGNAVTLMPIYTGGVATSWVWSPAQILSCTNCENPVASPVQNSTYLLSAKTQDGCEDTAMTQIFVRNTDVYVPTAFTPNNDGVNDNFSVFVTNPVFYHLTVFNRWGQVVFESTAIHDKWNGTYNGEAMPFDNYIYILEVRIPSGKEYHKNGIITLLR